MEAPWLNQGLLGFGGVLRNFAGNWITCGYTTNINAKLITILKGLWLAWEAGFMKVVCDTDSMIACRIFFPYP